MAREINKYHISILCDSAQNCGPSLPPMPYPMKKHERRPRTEPFIGEPHL
jgi:hypothetical protein